MSWVVEKFSHKHARSRIGVSVFAGAWLVASVASIKAADLRPSTNAAFDRYVRATERQLDEQARGVTPFLRMDALDEIQRRAAYARLRNGEIVVSRMDTSEVGSPIEIPGGLCHHWVGAVLLPGASLERALALMQAYDRYHEIYSPSIRRSQLLARDGDRFKVSLQLFMKKIVSVVLNTEYDVSYIHVTARRAQVRSFTTRIAEVEDPDTARERERPVGHDNGFLWRFNNYCALEERDEGTYVQCESVSLSRAIPTGFAWLIGPFITSIPRDSLVFTLERMRREVGK